MAFLGRFSQMHVSSRNLEYAKTAFFQIHSLYTSSHSTNSYINSDAASYNKTRTNPGSRF